MNIINLLTLFVYISLLITNIWTYNHHKIDDIDVDSDDQDDDQAGVNDLFNPLSKKELEELLEELFENHGKKETDRLIPSRYQEEKSCYEKMSVQENRILHTKESIANGAQFLDVKFIEKNEKNELILHEKCMEQCCSSETNGACDTALLSLKAGHDGYRCYLFNCSNKCMFVKHDDFAVMRMKDKIQPEPIPTQTQPPPPPPTQPIPTKPVQVQTQKPPIVTEKSKCLHSYEFECKISHTCIAKYDVCNSFEDCPDGSDELDCNITTIKPVVVNTTPSKTTTTKLTTKENYKLKEEQLFEENFFKQIPHYHKQQQQHQQKQQQKPIEVELDQQKPSSYYYDDNTDEEMYNKNAKLSPPLQEEEDEASLFSDNRNDDSQKSLEQILNENIIESFEAKKGPKDDSNYINLDDLYDNIVSSDRKDNYKKPNNNDFNTFNKNPLIDKPQQQATNKPSEVISSITIDGTGQSGKDDKTRPEDFMSGTSMAIVLLVIGISLSIGMFIYFMVNAGYVNRKFKSRAKRDKNASADAEADYLINGMYL